MDVNQQMDMIFFPAELQKLATPSLEAIHESLLQIQQLGGEGLAPVLGDKNDT